MGSAHLLFLPKLRVPVLWVWNWDGLALLGGCSSARRTGTMGWSVTKRSKGRREPGKYIFTGPRDRDFWQVSSQGEEEWSGQGWWFTSPCTRMADSVFGYLSCLASSTSLLIVIVLGHNPMCLGHILREMGSVWPTGWFQPWLTRRDGMASCGVSVGLLQRPGWLVPHGPWGPVDEQRWCVFFWVLLFDWVGVVILQCFSLVWRHLGWRRLLQPHRKSSLRESHRTKIMVNNGNEGLWRFCGMQTMSEQGGKAQPLGFASSPWDLRLFSLLQNQDCLVCYIYFT